LELFSLTGFAFMVYFGQVKTLVYVIYEIKPGTSSDTKEEEETPKITAFYISIKFLIIIIMISAYWIDESTNHRLSC
jgi:hypothetical protein